jgi:hypothetical protein
MIVIQSYQGGLSGVQCANAAVKLHLGSDPALPDEQVLFVEYPAPGANPAGRDVWCEVEDRNWTVGTAIVFQIRPDHALRLSVSFLDRNRVAYTHWSALQGGAWQTVRIPLDQIRPNPYFQPPGTNTGAPIDVSEVARLGFAPQDPSAGQLIVGGFVVE